MAVFRYFVLALLIVVSPGAIAASEPVKNFPLVNQEGKPFQLQDFKGQALFVSFIFTRCPLPNMCPLTITRNKQIYSQWKTSQTKTPLHFLIVTLDPKFDTPAVLKAFAKARGLDASHFTLATGDPQVLADFAAEFNVVGIPSEGSISHNSKSILLGPDQREIKQYRDNEWNADQVLSDLRQNRPRDRKL